MSEEKKNEAPAAVEDGGKKAKKAEKTKKPRNKKKTWTVVGIVVVVLVICGIGAWNWHNTPGFCGTVCHYSMNSYVETYDQQANAQGVDKYGNAVSNTNAMLAVSHQSDEDGNLACLNCHVPSVSQQMGEVQETLTGDYYVAKRSDGSGDAALKEVDSNALIANAGGIENNGDAFCLRSGCHVTESGEVYTRDTLTELTKDMKFNPHRWTHGNFQCTDCHKSHRASVFYCTRCHADAYDSMPEGWVSWDESEQITQAAYGE